MAVYKKQPIEIILDTTSLSKEEIQEAVDELTEAIGEIKVYGKAPTDELIDGTSISKINNSVLQLAYSVKEERLIAHKRIQPHVSADIYPIYKRKCSWIGMITKRRNTKKGQ